LRERVLQLHELLHVLRAEQRAGIGDRVFERGLDGARVDVRQLFEGCELGIRHGEQRLNIGLVGGLDLFRGYVHFYAPVVVCFVQCNKMDFRPILSKVKEFYCPTYK